MQMKKVVVVLLSLFLLCSFGSIAKASGHIDISEDSGADISPRWSMILAATNYLEIDSFGKASMTASISGNSQVSSIRINSSLQRFNNSSWITISSWTRNYSGSTAFWSASRYINRGNYYRLVTQFTVYGNGTQESTTRVSPIKYY